MAFKFKKDYITKAVEQEPIQELKFTKTYSKTSESPKDFGVRMSAEGHKQYNDVLKLITHLKSRVSSSDQPVVENWRLSLEGTKAELENKEIDQAEFDRSVDQIYSVLRKNYIDDFVRDPVRAGRRHKKTKRSKRMRRKTAKK